jgi:tetratricopeptide (TPR) repeat protein
VAEDKKRNRWFVTSVLVVVLVGMLGYVALPIIGTIGKAPVNAASPNATQTPAAQTAEAQKKAEAYQLVLQREPENQTALRGLLEARLEMRDVKGAIEPLEKLAKLNPGQTEFSVLLAQAKQKTGDIEGAAQVYRDIITTKPGDLNALAGLSDLLVTQQRTESALTLLKDTLKDAPKSNQATPGSVDVTAVQVLLGKVFASQKRYDEAIATFDEAAKSNANDFQPVLYKALTLKEQGKLEAAKPLFDKAASLAPTKFKDQILAAASNQLPSPPAGAPGAPGAPPNPSAPSKSDAAPVPSAQPVPAEPPAKLPDATKSSPAPLESATPTKP